MRLIEIENMQMVYGSGNTAVNIFSNLNLTVNDNEIVSIVGKSGVGKSTLLNIMSGLIKPTSGCVKYNGNDLVKMKDKDVLKTRLDNFGFVFQDFQLISSLTVKDNIILPGVASQGKIDEQYFNEIIRILDIENKLDNNPSQLSGGEQQRVAIARALINKPKVIFADEPTGNLDRKSGNIVFELLFKCVSQHNITLVYVTHDMDKAKLAGRMLEVYDGEIKEVINEN